jgi:hypothetical protein
MVLVLVIADLPPSPPADVLLEQAATPPPTIGRRSMA